MGKLYKALEKAEKERIGGQALKVPKEQPLPEIPEPRFASAAAPVSISVPDEAEIPAARAPETQPVKAPAPISIPLPDEVVFPDFDEKLVAYREPGSVVSEQFRKLRTQLLTLNLPGQPKTIMVTSASEGEGKTLVSTNLATVLAHDLHSYALLVDADLRNPALSRWFGLNNGRGLSDYLTENAEIPDLLLKTKIAKLSVLSSGTVRDNPVELIGSKRMEALVRELKSRYSDRYIIFDSSPLLATTEPSVLTKLVDGIILVVRAGSTPRESVKQALTTIDPSKILGVVLNDLALESKELNARYFGSSRYYYRHGYGESKEHGEEATVTNKIVKTVSQFFRKDR
ncbi:MAG TPA: polysaccharide biosynthesis tyrosine autokinase [Syntrophales bacterium]|nr:polysaccharide biosynthesis tyrosine autokinase [Syntrophales bacterium]